ncbi:hypothetical protein BHE74_00040121 [Ensete ventricosum]|nr:hypothetical protein BHE74_00040121 [Ensete ventricosum]RZS15363.1 hypothetical protein BHM03_00047195 [Ensete ventricosum]
MGGTYRSARLSVRGPPTTRRFRKKSIVGSRLKKKSIVGGRSRKKKGRRRGKEKKKKQEGKKEYLARGLPAQVARGRSRFFSHARRRSASPRGEKDRGDVTARRRLDFLSAFFAEGRRCLRPSTSSSNATDEEMETTVFSLSEATGRRGGDRNHEALEIMEQAISADKQNPLPVYQKANILVSLKRYDEALKELDQLSESAPHESSIYALMGKIYKRLEMHEKAMFYFGLALDLKPPAADVATIKIDASLHCFLPQVAVAVEEEVEVEQVMVTVAGEKETKARGKLKLVVMATVAGEKEANA